MDAIDKIFLLSVKLPKLNYTPKIRAKTAMLTICVVLSYPYSNTFGAFFRFLFSPVYKIFTKNPRPILVFTLTKPQHIDYNRGRKHKM